MRPDEQGALLDDPCGGTGLLSVPIGRRQVAARCLCKRGQLQMSATIPLVSHVRGITTEQLQDLFPAGIPEPMERR